MIIVSCKPSPAPFNSLLVWLAVGCAACSSGTSGSTNWAVETNTETSPVFTTTANANGPWQDSEVTNSGNQVFQYIGDKYNETMSQ